MPTYPLSWSHHRSSLLKQNSPLVPRHRESHWSRKEACSDHSQSCLWWDLCRRVHPPLGLLCCQAQETHRLHSSPGRCGSWRRDLRHKILLEPILGIWGAHPRSPCSRTNHTSSYRLFAWSWIEAYFLPSHLTGPLHWRGGVKTKLTVGHLQN